MEEDRDSPLTETLMSNTSNQSQEFSFGTTRPVALPPRGELAAAGGVQQASMVAAIEVVSAMVPSQKGRTKSPRFRADSDSLEDDGEGGFTFGTTKPIQLPDFKNGFMRPPAESLQQPTQQHHHLPTPEGPCLRSAAVGDPRQAELQRAAVELQAHQHMLHQQQLHQQHQQMLQLHQQQLLAQRRQDELFLQQQQQQHQQLLYQHYYNQSSDSQLQSVAECELLPGIAPSQAPPEEVHDLERGRFPTGYTEENCEQYACGAPQKEVEDSAYEPRTIGEDCITLQDGNEYKAQSNLLKKCAAGLGILALIGVSIAVIWYLVQMDH